MCCLLSGSCPHSCVCAYDLTDCVAQNPHEKYDAYASGPEGGLMKVQVVLHSIMENGCNDYACGFIDDACLHSGITMLNEDLRATHGGHDAGIEFVLASKDPNGNPTSGILRHRNTKWFTQSKCNSGGFWTQKWDQSRYVNIFLRKPLSTTSGLTLLGYATLAWHAGSSTDGVHVLWNRWGECTQSGDSGSTTTHELGHYLGLLHTFEPNDGTCPPRQAPLCHMTGDLICDTTTESEIHFGCGLTHSCGSEDPVSNWMTYSNGECMDHFTLEQVRRMRCSLRTYRLGIIINTQSMPPSPPIPAVAPAPIPTRSEAPCLCKHRWSWGSGACQDQYGCSESAVCATTGGGLAGAAAWCKVQNHGCATEMPGGWSVCNPAWPLGACFDDDSWEVTVGGTPFSCFWFEKNDPTCTEYEDNGQMQRCPKTCTDCSPPPAMCPCAPPSPSLPPRNCSTQPDLQELLPALNLVPHSSRDAVAFANSTDVESPLLLPLRAPSTSGSIVPYLGGVEQTSSEFSVGPLRVASVRSVLRTPTVYEPSDRMHDRERVIVAIQAFDASGSTEVLKSGLSVTVTLSKAGESSVVQGCAQPAFATGMATCYAQLPAGWFNPSGVGSADVMVALRYSGDVSDAARTPLMAVTLAQGVSHSSLSSSGMTMTLPTSPRFPGDQFDVSVTASLIGVEYGMQGWTVVLHYASSALRMVSRSIDGIWGAAAPDESSGYLKLICNAPADNVHTNPLVRGSDIPIMRIRFEVMGGASVGGHEISLSVVSMINFGGNLFVENEAALALDHRDGGHPAGQLMVVSDETRGLFAYAAGGRAPWLNSAPLTGRAAPIGGIDVTARTVALRPHGPPDVAPAGGSSCSSSAPTIVSVSGCTVSLLASAPSGGGVMVTVRAAGFDVSVALVVWHPESVSIEAESSTLYLLLGCSARYEWTRVRARAGGLDVTPLLEVGDLQVMASASTSLRLVWVGNAVFAEGVASGTGTIGLTFQPSVTHSITVSSEPVAVASLIAHVVTSSQLQVSRPNAGTVIPTYSFSQKLNTEGDDGEVIAVAMTESGATLAPLPTDELWLTPLTTSLRVSENSSTRIVVNVGAVRESGCSLLRVDWRVCEALNTTVRPYVALDLPSPTGVRIISTSHPRLAPADDIATMSGISEATRTTLTVIVDFEDPETGATSTGDFSSDKRMTLSTDSSCGAVSGNEVTTASDDAGCSGQSMIVVTATVRFGDVELASPPMTIPLVRYASMKLSFHAYPQGPLDVITLRNVQCTSVYQRARPQVVATLSTMEQRDVTAQSEFVSSAAGVVRVESGDSVVSGLSIGNASMTASFHGASDIATLSVVDEVSNVQSITLTSDAGSTLYGSIGNIFDTRVRVQLSDGTVYPDAHSLSWLTAATMLSYSSDTAQAVSVDGVGRMTLLKNHHSQVSISVQTQCTPTISATGLLVAPNLQAGMNDVDLGQNVGLQFQPTSSSLLVPVLVNVGARKLRTFGIALRFDETKLRAASWAEVRLTWVCSLACRGVALPRTYSKAHARGSATPPFP